MTGTPWHRGALHWGAAFATLLAMTGVARIPGQPPDSFAMVGAQGFGKPIFLPLSNRIPRLNVLEVDVWRHSLEDGSLSPVANVPIALHELINSEHFSPDFYREHIDRLRDTYARQHDVLMYFGGVPPNPRHHGLNFNGWSVAELQHLLIDGSRPFIGLETIDPIHMEWMARRLHDAGYDTLNRIYVRICSEPSEMFYGSDDGTVNGKHHTAAAYAAYRRRFADASTRLRALNQKYGLDMFVVFAGTNAEDFKNYLPASDLYDALGYDLYVTPENNEKVIRQIQAIRRRLPWKPIVIPEFGIATTGPGASPRWAQNTLGNILMLLERHPAGVAGVTVFSVNVAGRLPHKRWSWAWTPTMFEMLKEWQLSPRRWRKEGFHRYDPLSYPVGRDVLYLDHPDLRIVYRKLGTFKAPGVPYFYEVRFALKGGQWTHRTRIITLE